jgi:hypothetical protein
MASLRDLWAGAGLHSVETREIIVERTFANFEEYWATSTITGSVRPPLDAMTANEREQVKAGVRARLPPDAMGRVTHRARANAVKGRVPT